MARKAKFVPETYHHIYNRGTEKRKVFLDKSDYYRFLILLHLCNNNSSVDIQKLDREGLTFADIMSIKKEDINTLVNIGAYCLMPNHIDLLIKSKSEKKTSKFLQKLFTAYTMYFNKKYGRTGRLFESSAKSKLIDEDRYLKYLFAYIHLNPVKLIKTKWKEKMWKNIIKTKNYLDNYAWSSYYSYTNEEFKNSILNKKVFPDYFKTVKKFDDFIKDWLNFKEV